MKRLMGALGVAVLPACSVEIDESKIFYPQPLVPIDGVAPHGGLAGEDALDAAVTHFALPLSGDGDAAEAIAASFLMREGPDRPLIVRCGGNASDRWSDGAGYARSALPYGDVLLFDYPGYGDSGGTPSPESFQQAIEAVSLSVLQRGRDRDRVYWGHSLGGFVCAHLAARDPEPAGIILETTAPSVDAVAAAWTPWYAKPFVRVRISPSVAGYDNVATLAKTDAPLLVLGAGRDRELEVGLSRDLALELREAGHEVVYEEFPEAGHNDVAAQPSFEEAIGRFFAKL